MAQDGHHKGLRLGSLSEPIRQDERSIAVCETLYIRVAGTRIRKERGVLLQVPLKPATQLC